MKFYIEPEKVKRSVNVLDNDSASLGSKASAVEGIKEALNFGGGAYGTVQATLDICVQNLNTESKNTKSLSEGLRAIVDLYETHEKNIYGHITKTGNGNNGQGGNGNSGNSGNSGNPSNGNGGNNSQDKPEKPDPRGWYGDKPAPYADGKVEYTTPIFDITRNPDGTIDVGDVKLFEAKASGEAAIGRIGGGYDGEVVDAEGHMGFGYVSGGIGAGALLFDDGKFSPQVYATAEAKASAIHADGKVTAGSEDYNVHAEAQGDLAVAKAEGTAAAGVIKNEDGSTEYGVKGEFEAGAYLAEGEVKGGFTIAGIEFNGSVGGGVGGAGVEGGGSVTTGGVSGKAGIGLLVGVDVEFSIDWSGFEMPEIDWPW